MSLFFSFERLFVTAVNSRYMKNSSTSHERCFSVSFDYRVPNSSEKLGSSFTFEPSLEKSEYACSRFSAAEIRCHRDENKSRI